MVKRMQHIGTFLHNEMGISMGGISPMCGRSSIQLQKIFFLRSIEQFERNTQPDQETATLFGPIPMCHPMAVVYDLPEKNEEFPLVKIAPGEKTPQIKMIPVRIPSGGDLGKQLHTAGDHFINVVAHAAVALQQLESLPYLLILA